MEKLYGRNLIGILIIAVGFGFLLDGLGVFDFSSIAAEWWPLLIVLIGAISLINTASGIIWPLLLIAVGAILQLSLLDIIDISITDLILPVVLLLVGASLLRGKSTRTKKGRHSGDASVNASAIFSGIELKNSSDKFDGGDITAIFGGVDLDLREAKLKDSADLDIYVAFGGIGLKVPEDWNVVVTSTPLFGGIEDNSTKPTKKNAPTLRLTGTCLFGGVEIKN